MNMSILVRQITTRPVFSLFILATIMFTGAASDAAGQSGLRWVRGSTGIPAGSVIGGEEKNGASLYICRTTHSGSTLSGKVVAGKCNYNWGNTEYMSGAFEILVGSGGYWTRDINARTAIVGGTVSGQSAYVCRAISNSGTHPGRIQNGKCNYGFGGRGYAATNFEVLNGGGAAATVSLLDAALSGNVVSVRSALRAGQAINQKNTKGQTALMLAASKGAADVVYVLLNQGATVDARDNDGFTALTHAAFHGDSQSVRQLIRAGANVSSRSNNGYTAHYFAGASGDIETVQAIMSDRGSRNESSGYPLHGAAAYNRTAMIDFLLNSQGTNVDEQDVNGQTALVVAARNNRAGAATALLRAGANVAVRTSNNSEVFGLASLSNATDVIGVLLNSGKFPIKSPLVEAGLRTAAKNSKIQALNLLLQSGVNADGTNNLGNTALMLAAIEGHDDAAQALLNAHVKLDAKNARGETALILAASGGKRAVVKLLVKAGADVKATDNNGKTAVQYAAQNNHGDTRKDLEKAGGN